MNEEKLSRAVQWASRQKNVSEVMVRAERRDTGESWFGSCAGDLTSDRPFYIASTTKLYTSALIFQLIESGVLSFDSLLADHLPARWLEGLHVHRRRDASREITVTHLLSHSSGLADYFQGKARGKRALQDEIFAGHDQSWDVQQVLSWAKEIGAAFPPSYKKKALYSDTNYQLLGLLIEEKTGRTFEENLRERIIEPLGLSKTWLSRNPDEASSDASIPAEKERVVSLRYGNRTVHIPRAMHCFGSDGGIVSTTDELMTFLRAFFEGRLFRMEIEKLLVFRKIFFPLEYGVGLMRFRLPRLFSPFSAPPAFLGHSGLSGAFAFYCPDRRVYLCGTVNQVQNPSISFQLMVRLAQAGLTP